MDKSALAALYYKYLQGDYSPEELVLLLDILDRKGTPEAAFLAELIESHNFSEPINPELKERAEKIIFLTGAYLTMHTAKEEMDRQVEEPISENKKSKRSLRKYYEPFLISLALFLTTVTAMYFYNGNYRDDTQLTSRYGNDVLPGRNQATLILADGNEIALDSMDAGLFEKGNGISISLLPDGALEYVTDTSANNPYAIEYHTVYVPHGGSYRVILPDRSMVWLNAGTTLTFPTKFWGNERDVKLDGEAFFIVEKDERKPFSVRTLRQTIHVTGTEFNVNAYAEELKTETTLLEGGVSIISMHGRTLKLTPGQQATHFDGKLTSREVDTEPYTAWKENMFLFHHTKLVDIIRQLSRWYDLDVELGSIPDASLFIEIKRDVPLSEVLMLLEKATDFKFEINGRRLRITQYEMR